MKGYNHIYTGNGTGKTTVAFGLALNINGAGKRVYHPGYERNTLFRNLQGAQFPSLISI